MKRLVWWCVRHDHLPQHRLLRRLFLRAIFKPISPRDLGSGIDGFYDLGPDLTADEVERFKAWNYGERHE